MTSAKDDTPRRLPIGAEVQPKGGVHFRVWAPESKKVSVLLGDKEELPDALEIPLQSETGGYWSGLIPKATAGMHYRYKLDSGTYADPASRFQSNGPHGASEIIDHTAFAWSDEAWKGVTTERQVIYEMHIGTFTPEGTWEAATAQLPHLAELGVTLLEVMPVADFPGRYGWGYDGVNLYAPTRLYGRPDDFRRFVDRAHALGLGVILDVVYNHLGPDGNYLKKFSLDYFSETHKNDWGDSLNFDDKDSAPVREFFIANAGYWIDEFHCDGLRLDATQAIIDNSKRHILADITQRVREAAKGRGTYVVGENEPQHAQLLRPIEKGGYGIDALWNDDFHHTAVVAMTGRNEAYYTDYKGSPQEFISAAKWGFLFQGQRYKWQSARRGTPCLDLTSANFVNFLQNHDQIANSLWGRRVHTLTSAAKFRALTALLLLAPNTPMLFQGQEFAASAPFLYFADHNPELAAAVAKGREEFLAQFPSIASEDVAALIPNPEREETFRRCKLDFADREKNAEILLLHRDLLRIRKEDPLLANAQRGTFDGAVLSSSAFVMRFFGREQDDRLLVINLGAHLHLDPAPDPLLAPPLGCVWTTAWTSEDPRYGGGGTPAIESEDNWNLPAESAALLIPTSAS
ncbi:malto-oligosyltrehalose trehalohydrolase [Brevifollis gellanilyticus]|uniref:Malto-oligosyltrehalose trehalohydrolase n=1 Tax=Brevifollis gellanilyticus TaxID=748831 RepID=A0A512MI35_9BACT|nr:malto-oligosyltrehalose trehalohydrolase [Brevifollis gellanilyticus]GEP46390.1 malto-oligosyltrehalose trehalohydrolase [Brevifollis gellanilyticus]